MNLGYRLIFRIFLERTDPEKAHALTISALRVAHILGVSQTLWRHRDAPDPRLRVTAFGVRFPSPFGIAAGLDKNGVAVLPFADLGFGCVEVGTVTARPQPGNPVPRLFRLPKDRALVNRMGFNNRGSEALRAVLLRLPEQRGIAVGANIGKSRVVAVEDALSDYVVSAERLSDVADYLAVNVSSPNTPGLRSLQNPELLRPLLEQVRDAAHGAPVLVKIAPDMTIDDACAIADAVMDLGLAGIIATNTTIERGGLRTSASQVQEVGEGGLSGRPLRQRSFVFLEALAQHCQGRIALVSVGGVATADDVWRRLKAGASLVQGFTEFIYAGPGWARRMNRGLLRRLDASGFATFEDVTRSAYRSR